MAVRFSKLKTINLDNEDGEELEPMVGEEDEDGGANAIDDGGLDDDGGRTKLIIEDDEAAQVKNGRLPRWMQWSKRSYSPLKSGRRRKCPCSSWKIIAIAVFIFTAVFLISLIISTLVPEPTEGGVATDAPVCSDMSADILRRGGSAVDATITALLCVGVVHAESSGIGGGGFMVIRDTNGSVVTINFRETAPALATVDMFHSNGTLSELGGLSVGVPGEIRGMEEAHKHFGKLPWSELFQPVIKLCQDGFTINEHTESSVRNAWGHMSPGLRKIYSHANGTRLKSGDVVTRPILAKTLQDIATNGSKVFYSGYIADSIVRAVRESPAGPGIMSVEDLNNYAARIEKPVQVDFNGYTIHATPAPSGGPLLLFLLNIMDNYLCDTSSSSLNLTYHRLVEAFKYGFALRTRLGDHRGEQDMDIASDILSVQANMTSETYAAYIRSLINDNHTYNVSHYHAQYYGIEDSGTSHISVLSPDGQAVSVTSTINTYFGSKVLTDTGIVLNNEMDDFSSPNITNAYGLRPSEANFISPGKRPLSSTCPIIITKPGSVDVPVRLIIGGSGGSHIPTAVAQAALRVMSLGESVADAIKAKRLHHQLLPNIIYAEENFPSDMLYYLSQRGHTVHNSSAMLGVVQGIAVDKEGNVEAYADPRKNHQPGHAVVVERV